MIHVVAMLTAKPGKGPELMAALNKVVPQVHAEKGCVEYQPVTDAENASDSQAKVGPDTLVVIEKWETMDDLKAHSASAHMAEFGKEAGELIAGRTIHVLS